MSTPHDIHTDIEPWLAASVHDQLSAEERKALQEHLATCETCRALHAEEITMSTMIASTLETAKPDLAFEQRVLSGFRKKVPDRAGLASLIASLLRHRATQITAIAAVMLTLTMTGGWLTNPPILGNEELATPERGSMTELRTRLALGSRTFDAMFGNRTGPQSVTSLAFRNERKEGFADLKKSDAPAQSASGGVAPMPMARPMTPPSAALSDSAPNDQSESEPEPKSESSDVLTVLQKRNPDFGAPTAQVGPDANRKLVRNAQVELEVQKFDDAVQKITAFATEDRGYVATSSSEKQANGKLRGEVVVKVLPDKLDAFLVKLRGLGDVKNQTLGTDDVTKQYFDTDSRLKNARVMEQRLIDILKTKTGKVSDLLEVEKELGRVRASIEQMQGELKYMDTQVAFATVTITLAEKDMNVPAAFLLKRRAQLALFSTDVEKTFAEAKGVIDGTKAQISSSTLDRDSAGEATARLVLLIVAEEADALIDRIKGMGRVQNYNEQTERVAQGGTGMGENAKVERDKVELSITISRNEQEPALQTTSLRILTSAVSEKVAQLKANAAKSGAEIRSSSFNSSPNGYESADITLRVPMKNYAALLRSFDQLGKVKDVNVRREDRRGTINEETAPADITIQVYSQPNIISDESGLFATIRHTLAQGAAALMWSLRMIGVALAFLAPWALALAAVVWILKRVSRARKARNESKN